MLAESWNENIDEANNALACSPSFDSKTASTCRNLNPNALAYTPMESGKRKGFVDQIVEQLKSARFSTEQLKNVSSRTKSYFMIFQYIHYLKNF